jgi:hypothetical protein
MTAMNLDAPIGTALAEMGVPIGTVDVERFNRLSGMTFGSCSFVPDLRRARELLASRPYLDPVFFLPIGSAAYPQINSTVATLALHLRPCDVAARRLPVVAISTGTIGQRTPIAHDIDYLVWRALAREAQNEGRFSLDEVARANEIFGPGFFDPGRLNRPTRDEVLGSRANVRRTLRPWRS